MDDEYEKAFLEANRERNQTLAGWSPGDEDLPVPALRLPTEAQTKALGDGWRQPKDAIDRLVMEEDQHLEFTLYYGSPEAAARLSRVDRGRRYEQLSHAGRLICDRGAPLVLMTGDFKVFRAKNIWSLLWLYLKVKIFGIKKPNSHKKRPLPKYR